MENLHIYGADIELPEVPEIVHFSEYSKENQYWRRSEIPHFFDEVRYDNEGNLILTGEQIAFAEQEVRRCKEGFWFYNNGVPTFITGKNYFFLQWWKLENDVYPDYRDSNRRYFLFLDHYEKQLWCLGIFRGKKRRESASSVATCNLVYECIFFKNSNCGLISKTRDDSKDTFTDMAAFGYRQLPPFLKPKQLNKEDTVSELLFANKAGAKQAGTASATADLGHRSKLNFRAPVLNAYDRGRMTRILADEGGKWPSDVPFSRFISIVSNTLVIGAKRVGFMECPSTVNEMTKGGGAEFKVCWDNANQFKFKNKITPNNFVTYFSAAYEGFEGFIDRYGISVIGEPTIDQFDYLCNKWVGKSKLTEDDIRIGAKEYLIKRRELITDTQLLEEEIRQYPFDEEEMFLYAGFGCEFNAVNVQKQIRELEDNPVMLRRVRMVLNKKVKKGERPGIPDVESINVTTMDDERGGWYIYEYPNKSNFFEDRGGYYFPMNKSMYQIGVDTTKDIVTVHGSKPVICILKKSCIIEGVEMGLYPVAYYLDNTRLDIHFDEEVFKACLLYGCTANYEIDARADYWRTFSKLKGARLLEWTPKFAQNPIKANLKIEPGTRSGDPFQFAQQLQVAKMFVDGTDPEVYNGHVHKIVYPTLLKQLLKYDNNDRTKSDEVIALMMALLPVMGEMQMPVIPNKIKELLPQYVIKKYA